ncbi:hypothetical protein GG804_15250 [Sphingomonas histidinilytica]|uniref:hypothetical protein n=1 Tax=Rhizorhabdus histidinilytica TaxID=439228 RepID=UPI001ADB4428|nr:hypothetical protein [Rhizorhabdus histidinilytica]MBO9378127.1 hypothetical protein [Rhizorhabdus histidinilytica]
MKTVFFGAVVAALSLGLGATPAFARAADPQSGGHYEWRTVPQPGPRSAAPVARKRVWVPHGAQMANCDCEMMKMSAHDCMKPMHDGSAAPSAG